MPFTERPLTKWYPYYLADSVRKKDGYFYENFTGVPFAWNIATPISALATAGAAQVDGFLTPLGNYIEMYQTTAQTIFPTFVATGGWDLQCDQVDNESLELVPGGNTTCSPLCFLTGTSPDFFIKAKVGIANADGSDQFVIGFRKVQAYAVPTSFLTTGDALYTDYFGVGFAATVAAANPLNTTSDLNNAGSAVVQACGFTWADTLVHTLEVRVIGRRCYVYINGCILGSRIAKDGNGNTITAQNTLTGPNFSFDTADSLVPFIFLRQDALVTGAIVLYELEIGALRDVGLDKGNE